MPLEDDGPDRQLPVGGGDLTPAPRASDADRDTALERLKAAFVDGKLSDKEFDQRAHAALTARSTSQLERLLMDLPPSPVDSTTPGTANDRPVRFTVAILGETERRWRWRVAPRLTAGFGAGPLRAGFASGHLHRTGDHDHGGDRPKRRRCPDPSGSSSRAECVRAVRRRQQPGPSAGASR